MSGETPVEPPATAPEPYYYKFPPFPEPPPGANVPVWSEFKPAGIRLRFEDSGEPEVDGRGIPTVQLASSHALTDSERMKSGKSKKLKKTMPGPNGAQIRLTWYQEWELDENRRRANINPYVPLSLPLTADLTILQSVQPHRSPAPGDDGLQDRPKLASTAPGMQSPSAMGSCMYASL
jgi:hypothetical protein